MTLRLTSPSPCFISELLTTSRSFGFSLRNANANVPPVRTVMFECTVRFLNTLLQNSARKSSTTVIGTRPAFTISSTSSSSRTTGASSITIGAFRAPSTRHSGGGVLVVEASLSNEHCLTRKIVHRSNRRRSRTGDHHFAHVGARRSGERNELLPVWSDGQHSGNHIHPATREAGTADRATSAPSPREP